MKRSSIKHARLIAAAAAVVGAISIPASGKNWADGTGLWNVNSNWSPAAVPGAGEAVNIVFTDGTARTVSYNVNAPSLGLFSVDLTGAGTAGSTFAMTTANTLSANGILIGGYNGVTTTAGRGAGVESAGSMTTNPGLDFVLGYGAGSTGTFALSGTGVLTANQSEYIGLSGTGSFTQTGGTNTIATATGFFDIGTNAGSSGTYNLSGAASVLTVKTNENVGDIGSGVFNQSGGTHSIQSGKSLFIGNGVGGAGGSYTLSDGTLSVTGGSGTEYIGYRDAGTFIQSGGTNSISGGLGPHLGTFAGSSGVYILSGGSTGGAGEVIGDAGAATFTQTGGINGIGSGIAIILGSLANSIGVYNLGGNGTLDSGYDTRVGESGSGTFNQTGGTHTISEYLTLGYNSGGTGVYNLSAGTLIANTFGGAYRMIVGGSGNGTFNQTGGSASLHGMEVAFGPGNGAYNLSGGSATVGADVVVGGTLGGGTGVLTVSGSGVLTVGGFLTVVNAPGNVIHLNGGTINTNQMNLQGNPAALDWTAGTLNFISNENWGPGGPMNTGSIFGAALTLGNNRTLQVTGDESLGFIGGPGFTLTLNSGSAHVVTGTLTLPAGGTITQNPGSTLNAATFVQAGGTINGTLQNQGNFVYQSGSFNGRLLNQGTVDVGPGLTLGNGVENDLTITLASGKTLTANGAGLDNQNLITLSGGTVGGTGPLVNSGTISGFGTIAGSTSGFTNNGNVTVAGGTMTLANAAANTNAAGIDLAPGTQLKLSGAALANAGAIDLGGGIISGTSILNNNIGGLITGKGTISAPLSNNSGGTIVVQGGTINLTQASINAGTIDLDGPAATLTGAAITNNGIIRGDGVVGNAVTNGASGEIRGESGKTITLAALSAANAGKITLLGGTVDLTAPLTNGATGLVQGHGTFKANAGLTNNGQVQLTGDSDVFGPITGNSLSKVIVAGNSTATFYSSVMMNSGSEFRVSTGSTAVFLAPVTGASFFTGGGIKDFEAGSSLITALITAGGSSMVQHGAALTTSVIREESLEADGMVTILPDGTSAATSHLATLIVRDGGRLDLSNNKLIVTAGDIGSWNGSAYTGMTGMIASGRNGSAVPLWDGNGGIVTTQSSATGGNYSSLAIATAAQANRGVFGGLSVSPTDVLVMYTYGGDATLDGKLNIDDYVKIDSGIAAGLTAWVNGDFNYDGKVNIDDYTTLIDANIGNQSAVFPSGGGGLDEVVAVPEPIIAALLFPTALVVAVIGRRRRIVG